MHRKRDPNDVRFWPRSEGGQGFRHPNDTSPSRQYSALRTRDPHGNLLTDDSASVTAQTVTSMVDYAPETVRSRARAALLLAIARASDTLSDRANELKLTELAPTMAALGRISGVQSDDTKDSTVSIHIVRDTPPQLPTPPTAIARLLPPDGAVDGGA